MARFSGATVLLILVATVSVYTCAILSGAALGRTLDHPTRTTTKQPEVRDIALRISVNLRGLAEDFAKELWGGNHRLGRSGGGARTGSGDRAAAAAVPSSAARASLRHTQAELEFQQSQHQRFTQAELEEYERWHMLMQREASQAARREIGRRDGVHDNEGGGAAAATTRTVPSDTELWGRYRREEGRSGNGDRAAAAAAALPSSAATASLPLSPAELAQYRQQLRVEAMVRQLEANRPEKGIEGRMTTTEQRTRPLPRHSNYSDEITEGTRGGGGGGAVKVGPWGGSGGQAFYMRGGGGAGVASPRLLSVTVYHADAVHAFSFEYLLGGARRTVIGPSGSRSHGSKGLRATINFSPDEHLTAVEGTFGRCRSVSQVVVTSLTFRTDKGRTYGPYGEVNGTPFSVPAASGCIVGFWGRSGWLLDAIGVYIMPCPVYRPAFFVSDAYRETS